MGEKDRGGGADGGKGGGGSNNGKGRVDSLVMCNKLEI